MSRDADYRKTVFVLGAGFSVEAGGPPQSRLLELLLNLDCLHDEKTRVVSFLKDTMGLSGENLAKASLEDIYTPIDRCLADRVSFRGKTQTELESLRADIDILLSMTIKRAFEGSDKDGAYVEKLAKYLVDQASVRGTLAHGELNADKAKKHDPVSVISLNWDILLDNSLDSALMMHDVNSDIGEFTDYAPFGVVDYCCYVSSLNRGDRRIRSGLWSLGAKGYNVKLLKIHGSLNWLQCTNCQRLFTSFGSKLLNEIGQSCRHCSAHEMGGFLKATLVMPTFLKDFSNFQLKLVWQNTAVELMEASKLVFIGYSLPESDFEFRQLLSRMIHRSAEIDVVLWGGAEAYQQEKERYDQFFAGHPIEHFSEGAAAYVSDNVP